MSWWSWLRRRPSPPPVPPPPSAERLPVHIVARQDGEVYTQADGCVLIFDDASVLGGDVVGVQMQFLLPFGTPYGWHAQLGVRHAGQTTWVDLTLAADVNVTLPATVVPWTPAPREYRGNMCGIYVSGLPPVPGGSRNADLVLSWFYDRYDAANRARIRQAWKDRGDLDVLLSWPDSRAVGASPESFRNTCVELVGDGFRPCVMMCSKDFDPSDVAEIQRRCASVLQLLARVAGRICVGWELSIWLQPVQVQALIEWMAPQVTPWGGRLYVHFQEGYASFDVDGPNASFAGFWNRNIGKLTGVLHQRQQTGDVWDPAMYQARLVDILQRFAGQFNCSPDSGFGHPFDCIALEITAMDAFNANLSEAEQNRWGNTAITAAPVMGPFGPVRVMGSGNGS